jgi:hypothetical protein
MDTIFVAGSLLLGIVLTGFCVRSWHEGGRQLLPMGLAFIVGGLSQMLAERVPGARDAGGILTAMLVTYALVVGGREVRRAMRVELWLGAALVAILGVSLFGDFTPAGNRVVLVALVLVAAAFIGTALMRVVASERSIRQAHKSS